MNGSQVNDGAAEEPPGLDTRRRRALFRAWHRGTREMDIVMGRFADREIATMSEPELVLFERLLDLPETDVFGWIAGRSEPPSDIDGAFLARLRAYPGG